MLKEKIGYTAGTVWMTLVKGEQGVKIIKKETKLTDKEIYLALGWLAREGKIALREDEKDIYASLL
jgi:hypothetical protein